MPADGRWLLLPFGVMAAVIAYLIFVFAWWSPLLTASVIGKGTQLVFWFLWVLGPTFIFIAIGTLIAPEQKRRTCLISASLVGITWLMVVCAAPDLFPTPRIWFLAPFVLTYLSTIRVLKTIPADVNSKRRDNMPNG